MKQTVMLKKNYEFKIVLTKGRFYIGKQLKIVILKNGKNFKTLGIAVSTKNGKAFQRNKAKRLIREAYKNLEEKIINGYSIVVLLKKDIDITVYTGPDKSRLVDNQLRGQGATYLFPVGTITNLHTTDKGLVTIRDIGVGSSRMEMIFSYGSPNAMWRNQTDESYIFLYEGHSENSWSRKKEFNSSIENTNNNSQQQSMLGQQKEYIAFTIKQSNVEAVDMISGQVWPRFGLPKAPVYDFQAGKLTADDFVLRGYKLNDYFVNDPNNDWKHQGMLFGSTFIGYNEYGVSVDKKNLINRVLLNIYTPTRRGIAMGDTKYLLLFVYGMPTRIAESTTSTGTATVYEYKNPAASDSYLQFALDDKNQYIKSVMLSDRPVK